MKLPFLAFRLYLYNGFGGMRRQPTATFAHQCCTLSDTAGTFKSSTAFAIAARGTYSGLLVGNTFTPGLDDLYTFSYVLPL